MGKSCRESLEQEKWRPMDRTPSPPPLPSSPQTLDQSINAIGSANGADIGEPYDVDVARKQLDAAIKKQQDALKAKPRDDTSSRPNK
jgi:hypothetical protein